MYIHCVCAHAVCESSVRLGQHLSATSRWRHPVKCLAQGHSKQARRLVLHTIPIVLSAEQGSCEYHFLVFWYDSTWEMDPGSTDCEEDTVTATPSRRFCNVAVACLN